MGHESDLAEGTNHRAGGREALTAQGCGSASSLLPSAASSLPFQPFLPPVLPVKQGKGPLMHSAAPGPTVFLRACVRRFGPGGRVIHHAVVSQPQRAEPQPATPGRAPRHG